MRADNDKSEFGLEFVRRYNKDNIIFKSYSIYKYSINRVNERYIYITDYKTRLLLFNADLFLEF